MAGLVEIVVVGFVLVGLYIGLSLEARPLIVEKNIFCPVNKIFATIGVRINVFRRQGKKGALEICSCSVFDDSGAVLCDKPCLRAPEVTRLHTAEKTTLLEQERMFPWLV